MEAIHNITRVTATQWTWLRWCWCLRTRVVALARALEIETGKVEALQAKLRAELDAKHLVELELKALQDHTNDTLAQFRVARDGNQALLRFIHTRHRLNIKFDPNTIRAALQNADRNGGKR